MIPPGSNSEPLKVPGQINVIIAINTRSHVPTIIDSQDNAKHLPPPYAVYTMAGNEKYVNPGWLVPKGQEKAFPGSSNTFTLGCVGLANNLSGTHLQLGIVVQKIPHSGLGGTDGV